MTLCARYIVHLEISISFESWQTFFHWTLITLLPSSFCGNNASSPHWLITFAFCVFFSWHAMLAFVFAAQQDITPQPANKEMDLFFFSFFVSFFWGGGGGSESYMSYKWYTLISPESDIIKEAIKMVPHCFLLFFFNCAKCISFLH